MSCKGCLNKTGSVIIVILNYILMLVGLVMIGGIGYFSISIQKSVKTNVLVGWAVGLYTFFFPMTIVCGCYKVHCYLVFENILMILLTLAECVFIGLYFNQGTTETIKKILSLPVSYYDFISKNTSIIAMIIGSILGIQLITVIMQGIRASEIIAKNDNYEELVHDVEKPRANYRDKAIEKYDLKKHYSESNN